MTQSKPTVKFPARHGGTITKNPCGSWSLTYWLDGKQRQKTFRDTPGKPGSGKLLAEDFALKLTVGKREGDTTFADKSKGAVRFVDYAGEWIDAHRNPGTRAVLRSTLKLLAGRAWQLDPSPGGGGP